MKAPDFLFSVPFAVILSSAAVVRGAEETPVPKAPEKEAAPAAENDGNEFKLLAAESIGKIRHEQKAADLIKIYGEPKSKGEPEQWEAIGEWVEEWNYPELGVVLRMSSREKSGPKTVLIATAGKGCKLTTARGIKIGSTRAEVEKAYRDVEEKAPGDGPAKPDDPEPESAPLEEGEEKPFVAGTIYGGMIFSFKEGKVVEIFLGAAAE